MMSMVWAALILPVLLLQATASAQPRQWSIAVEVVDQVEPTGIPPHILQSKPELLDDLNRQVQLILEDLGRCRARGADADTNGAIDDFIARVSVQQLYKSYRNKEYLGIAHDVHEADALYYAPQVKEIRAEPILIARLEMELVEMPEGRRTWSTVRDSTIAIPYDRYDYIINPVKYPHAADPVAQQHFMADILRLTDVPRSPARYILNAADRWFISWPQNDIDRARGLLVDLVGTLYSDLDGRLPLEGQVTELLPDEDGNERVALGIGTVHGLVPKLKMDVWRPEPADQKVGQIQIIQVDSATAVAQVRKIDRQLRKRGEGVRTGDRVISKKRKSQRVRVPRGVNNRP